MKNNNFQLLFDRLKILLDAKSDAEIARGLKVSPQALSSFKKQEKFPSDLLIKYCLMNQVSIDWLLTGEGPQYRGEREEKKEDSLISSKMEEEYSLVPRYDVKVSAGGGAFIYDNEPILNHLAFRRDWLKGVMGLNPKKLSVITVIGDSMEPTIEEGDVVLVDHREEYFRNDGIHILNYDSMLIVKRLQFSPTGTTIKSDNPAYNEIFISRESQELLKITGRVVWLGKRI